MLLVVLKAWVTDPADFPLRPGILVYAVEQRVACWALNVRDSRLTSVDTQTRHALVVSESLDKAGAVASLQAFDWLADYISQSGGAVVTRGTLTVGGFCKLTY